jgi:hypothetical protein
MSPVETDVERRLRAGLQAWQDEISPAPRGFASRLRERERRRRQARASAAAGLVIAAALVATAGVVARGIVANGAADGVADSPLMPAPAGPEESGRLELPDLVDVPTRGSLAGDAGWVSGVREREWPAPGGLAAEDFVPRPEDRHVAFAGDVPGGRVALVLGEIGNRTLRMWFTGPEGADPADLRPAVEADDVLPDMPLALWDFVEDGADEGVLVVVAFPGDTAVYDPGLRPLDPYGDGVFEESRPVELVDGAGSTSAPRPVGLPLSTAVAVEHEADGLPVDLDVGDRAAAELGLPVLEDPRGLRAAVPDAWIDNTIDRLGVRGLELEGMAVTLLQAGGVRDTANQFSVLVAGTARNGDTAVVLDVYTSSYPVTATDAERGLEGGGNPVVTPTRADAAPPLEQVLAVPLTEGFGGGVPDVSILAVSAPVETGTVEVLDADGAVLATLPLERGGVASVVPAGAAGVRVLDAGGDLVAEQPLTEVIGDGGFPFAGLPFPEVTD